MARVRPFLRETGFFFLALASFLGKGPDGVGGTGSARQGYTPSLIGRQWAQRVAVDIDYRRSSEGSETTYTAGRGA
jgi:hypothetical protein